MVRIVQPIISSLVGRALEVSSLGNPRPIPQLLSLRRSIVTVDKPVGPGKPNQETDVLLVRLMLNLITATDSKWREKFKTPLPHEKKFDAELGRRIRAYQQEGGFQVPIRVPDNPPTPVVVTAFLNERTGGATPVGDGLGTASTIVTAKEALFTDGIIDPCQEHTDRGSHSKLVFTIVHFNYHLILRLKAIQSMRLTPSLIRSIDLINDPKLAPLRAELVKVEETDPDKPKPNPNPNPPTIII